MLKKHIKKTQAGFTLIEIIAVLVILGILAAVAVPRFIDLQSDAEDKAIEAALAAGASQLAMQYASDLLTNSNSATATTWSYSANDLVLGDFEVDLTGACGTNASNVVISNGPYGTGEFKTFTICNGS